MKMIKVIAKGEIPDWFKAMNETQQKQYLEEHPNSAITKTVKSEDKKENKPVENKPKQEIKKEVDRKPAEEIEGQSAQEVIKEDGSPTDFKGPSSAEDSTTGNPKLERKIVSLLDRLAKMVKDADEKGEKAPDYDLCEVSIPGTNLFCQSNVGIPRDKMPQLKGKPVPGSWADKNLPKDRNGEVDGEDAFHKFLKDKGISSTSKRVDVSTLKASQTQMVGTKVAGIFESLKKNPDDPNLNAPLFVSKDGYVLDGHHRWAGKVGFALADGVAAPVEQDIEEIDLPIEELIKLTNNFAGEIGIAQKAAKVTANIHYMFGGCSGDNCLLRSSKSYATLEFIKSNESHDWKVERAKYVKAPESLTGKVILVKDGNEASLNRKEFSDLDRFARLLISSHVPSHLAYATLFFPMPDKPMFAFGFEYKFDSERIASKNIPLCSKAAEVMFSALIKCEFIVGEKSYVYDKGYGNEYGAEIKRDYPSALIITGRFNLKEKVTGGIKVLKKVGP